MSKPSDRFVLGDRHAESERGTHSGTVAGGAGLSDQRLDGERDALVVDGLDDAKGRGRKPRDRPGRTLPGHRPWLDLPAVRCATARLTARTLVAPEDVANAVEARYAASDAKDAILDCFDTRAYAQSSQENVVDLFGDRV
jgi:hypothetical protein